MEFRDQSLFEMKLAALNSKGYFWNSARGALSFIYAH